MLLIIIIIIVRTIIRNATVVDSISCAHRPSYDSSPKDTVCDTVRIHLPRIRLTAHPHRTIKKSRMNKASGITRTLVHTALVIKVFRIPVPDYSLFATLFGEVGFKCSSEVQPYE